MTWLGDQFENRALFRRLVIVYVAVYLWMATDKSFDFAIQALESKLSGIEIGGIITALVALPTAIIGYIFKIYSGSRADDTAR